MLQVIVALPPPAPLAPQQFDWARFGQLLKSYIAHPISANARAVAAVLPYPNHVHYTNSHAQDSALETLDAALVTLERKVLAADTQAVRLAFRLFSVSDGYKSETLDQILGGLITHNPTLFLEQLQAHEQLFGDDFENIGGLVGNFGDGFVDNYRAQAKQAKRRITALLRVQRPDLGHVRDKCVSELNDQLASTLTVMESIQLKFERIEVGMTQRAVKSIMGKPLEAKDGFPVMIYFNGEVQLKSETARTSWFYCETDSSSGVITVYMVVFASNTNRVAEKSRDQTLGRLVFKYVK
jgi:hypothetical protein